MHCTQPVLTVLQAELTRCGEALARCQGERDALQGQISNDAQAVEEKQALEDAVKKQVGWAQKHTVYSRKSRPLCNHVSCAVLAPPGPVRPGRAVPNRGTVRSKQGEVSSSVLLGATWSQSRRLCMSVPFMQSLRPPTNAGTDR